jgi:tRNA(adenine34) deaminase
MNTQELWMKYAFKEAERAYEENEVPIGCIITFQNTIIAKAHNQVETLKDPTAHAEIIAITSAAEYLQSKADRMQYVSAQCAICMLRLEPSNEKMPHVRREQL